MSVKRYDIVTIYRGHESWDEMEDAEDGTYVRHDDYAELESKLETALRECRSAGITIDNLEAKCAALAAELRAYQLRQNANSDMPQCSEPVTDNTNQQFESLSRGDK